MIINNKSSNKIFCNDNIILFFLFSLFYLPIIFENYIFGDTYLYFDTIYTVKKKCTDHDQFVWLISLGRPLAALIDCGIFKLISHIEDTKFFRFLTFLLMLLTAFLFNDILKSRIKKNLTNIATVLVIFTLPTFIFAINIHNISGLLSIFLSLIAFYNAERQINEIEILVKNFKKNIALFFPIRTFISILLLYFASSLYISGPLLYIGLFIFYSVLDNPKKIKHKFFYFCIPLFFATIFFIINLLIIKFVLGLNLPTDFSGSYSINLNILEKIQKTFLLFLTIIPNSIKLWFIEENYIYKIFFITTFILCLLHIFRNRGVAVLVIILLCLIGSSFHFIVTNFPLANVNRLMTASSVSVILFLYLIMNEVLKKKFFNISIYSISILYIISNFYLNFKNIETYKLERDNTIKALNSVENLRHFYFKYPSNNGKNYYENKNIHDEFFIKILDRPQFTYFFFREALQSSKHKDFSLYECNPMKVQCVNSEKNISFFYDNNDGCLDKNYLFLDYTKINKLVNKENIKSCTKPPIYFLPEKDPLKMGLSHSLDGKINETSFFEASIETPIIWKLKKPSNVINYNFHSGNILSRLPISWSIYYKDGNDWVLNEIVNIKIPWKENSSKNFISKFNRKYNEFKIVFHQVNSSDNLIRLYEIKINSF